MIGVPTFMQDSRVCISRTHNGYALSAEANSLPTQTVAFETLDALLAYMAAHFPKVG